MFSGINNNAETSIAVSEKWIECMSEAFLQGKHGSENLETRKVELRTKRVVTLLALVNFEN